MAKRSKDQWRTLIREHQDSGLTAAEFCRRRGVDPKYFSVRKRQLGEAGSFVQAVSVPSVTDSKMGRLRILEVTVPIDRLPAILAQTGFTDELV